MILRVKFTKEGYLKYISHLDMMRLFQRAFRRAQIPIKYSEGFNPQPKFSIANPLALGIESIEEYMDMELYEKIPVDEFINRMNKEMPKGIKIIDAKYIKDTKAIASLISWSYYRISFEVANIHKREELDNLLKEFLSEEKIVIKKTKQKNKRVIEKEQNIRPLIGNVVLENFIVDNVSNSQAKATINCMLKAGDKGNLKPMDFIKALSEHFNLDIDFDNIDIKRLSLLIEDKGQILPPM
ncbi:TIGR03936 family radical SAM-associated protein [Tepidimicrobium xylanilyticum]|uniref:Radical SAM-linked protein n=1 Tax=Tepidimicrobium xylanilyticum TaxID=1123352 RepID=A0A1H3BVD4_9FIRM|nr:TIGR03936 family radical SAM-associated protein [Tepidimicrobium xylanilyticum]SDX45129.1 radical SAM-linked protein [Tepidimicrobium xylanilyticum]